MSLVDNSVAKEPVVTVVMPVYNAEKYLNRALDSVLAQTFSDWELIAVNDGSSDKSGEILVEYSKKDDRIRFFNIENSGSAKYPRDMAIYLSQTQHVVYLDADDWIDADYLEIIWNRYLETNAQLIITRMVAIDEASGKKLMELPNDSIDKNKVYEGKQLVRNILCKWDFSLGGAFFDRKILADRLAYPPNIKSVWMNSDEVDSRYILCQNPLVAYADTTYYYWINSKSITNRISIKRFHRLVSGCEMYELINGVFGLESEESNLINEQNATELFFALKLFYKSQKDFSKDEQKWIDSQAHKLFDTIDFNRIGGITSKFSGSWNTYKFFVRLRLFLNRFFSNG